MEDQDKKVVEKQYIDSYHYTTTQRVVAIIAVVVVLSGIIACGAFLFMSLISLL